MTRRLFITATDTGAGKTYVTAALARLLRRQGADAIALKPVASGLDAEGRNEDIEALLAAQGLDNADAINLHRLRMPAAPMVAAHAESRPIDLGVLNDWCTRQAGDHDICLVEGVGGLMVPLAEGVLVRDWLQAMPDTAVVLVVGAHLGCMNHALLTLAELARIKRTPAWVIFNALADDDMAIQCEAALRPWLPPACRSLQLPYTADPEPVLLPLVESLAAS